MDVSCSCVKLGCPGKSLHSELITAHPDSWCEEQGAKKTALTPTFDYLFVEIRSETVKSCYILNSSLDLHRPFNFFQKPQNIFGTIHSIGLSSFLYLEERMGDF
jgi:hypothetical protein